jgi:hypothetical protein
MIMIVNVKSLSATYSTVREMLAIPGVVDGLRKWIFGCAKRDGLSDADADDAAQRFFMMLLKAPEGIEPTRAVFGARRFLKRMGWHDRTGARRKANRLLPMPVGDIVALANVGSRSGLTDNPAAIVSAMETVQALSMTACGRNAKALRKLSMDDIRGMACPAMQGGTPVETVDDEPVTLRPMPAQPGDGTEWRGSPEGLTVEYQSVRGFALRHWY